MEPDESLLEVKGLKKYFPIKKGVFERTKGYVKAVDDVSFNIRRGQIFGLVGESGCGKSTTGRTILKLTDATCGSVRFEGKVIFDVENNVELSKDELQRLRRDMQIVFQDPYASLDPRKSVGYIVSEGILKHKLCKNKKEALEMSMSILELCGLPGSSVKKYPHEFSGGQRQRIGIARSLALNPKFIIGDEPIAALDVSIQAQVISLLQELIERFNLTTLFISHDLGVVKYFCDMIGVMYLGTFVEMGKSEDVFRSPLHPYTQALISAIPKSMPNESKDRIILEGDIPSPANPPSGCKFHTRCRYAKNVCIEETPAAKKFGDSIVSCHLYD